MESLFDEAAQDNADRTVMHRKWKLRRPTAVLVGITLHRFIFGKLGDVFIVAIGNIVANQ